MKELIENFAKQLEEGLIIGENVKFARYSKPLSNVLIVGMGGSGIAGTIISELVSGEAQIPILVSKTYFLPECVNEKSLVVISSYSGNTEESIEAMKLAEKRGAKIVCITSGGKILDIAKQKKMDHIVIPGGIPPRAGFAYSLVSMFYILYNFKIISNKFKQDFKASILLLKKEEKKIQQIARGVAETLLGRLPIIYASAGHEGVSVRFRQQLNENAKVLAWHHTIPEMNHNELVGWTKKDHNLAVVIFRNESDYSRIKHRINFVTKIISKYTPNIIEIHSKGRSVIEKAMYHIHLGDWASALLAEMKKVDVNDIEVIESLKASLQRLK